MRDEGWAKIRQHLGPRFSSKAMEPDGGGRGIIKTVRGVGYVFAAVAAGVKR